MSFVTSTYVSRVGRLGNSLFQIATTLAYGKEHNKTPVFTKWDYQDYIPLTIIKDEPKWNRVAGYDLKFEKLEHKEGDVDLHGHFISLRYFNDYESDVKKVIKLDKLPKINLNNTCAIHVRRSDYLQQEQANYHGVLGMDYYNEAMDLIKSKYNNIRFIVFSDDIEWCKNNFKGVTFVNNKDIIDLFIMSKCTHNIIANSTFSWWAAYLNNGTVVAPDKFFVSGHDKDLYKKDWLVIN